MKIRFHTVVELSSGVRNGLVDTELDREPKRVIGNIVPTNALEILRQRRVLISGADGNMTRQVVVIGWQGGDRPRFFCFDLEAARVSRKVPT